MFSLHIFGLLCNAISLQRLTSHRSVEANTRRRLGSDRKLATGSLFMWSVILRSNVRGPADHEMIRRNDPPIKIKVEVMY